MTLLEEFVFSLNKTERRKLRPLQFRGIKRRLFLKIFACTESKGINSAKIVATYKLSRKRYNQISSEILAACYRDVSSLGGTELLQYLGNRQLYRHFFKEMRRQEQLLRETNDRKQLENFYFKVLLMSEFFLIPPHLEGSLRDEITIYLHRYLEIKQPQHCDECLLLSAKIEEEINDNFMRGFSLTKLRSSSAELEKILLRLKKNDPALAKIKVAYMLAMIYFGAFFEDKKPDPYIAYVSKTVDEHPELFGSVGELIKLGVKSYVIPKDKDIQEYKRYLLHPAPTGEGSSLLFIERFLPLIVKAGEFKWAKEFIAARFPKNIDQVRKDIAVHWWRLLLIYYTYSAQFKEAELALKKAFAANTGRNRNIDVEINLRCYGVYLHINRLGPDLAAKFILRHIRFANRHGYNKGEGFMMVFLKSIHDLVSRPNFDKIHALKVRHQYITYLAGEQRLYPLFEKIYQKYFL